MSCVKAMFIRIASSRLDNSPNGATPQVIPNAALSYYAYEAFKRVLDAED